MRIRTGISSRKRLKTPGSVAMLLIVVYLYASSLTLWSLTVASWFTRTRAWRRAVSNAAVTALGTPMEALFMFNMIVGDGVVVWRAWVLYARARWVVGVPCLMLCMSFIFTVIDLGCLAGAGYANQTAMASGGAVCERAELSWAFSFVTNGTCTVLIGYKAWQHRRSTRALNTTITSTRLSTNRILSLLVESGFIYCLFWLTQYILFVDISRAAPVIYVYELFAGMGDQISGMYPTLIIAIVNLHQTLWDDSAPDARADSAMHFAAGAKRSGSDGSGAYSGARLQLRTDVEGTGSMAMSVVDKRAYSPDGPGEHV
ncbi:hypothetical protein B0H14DRAFT_2758549 [Mycena olivaceomarginata]|nr:hypothetical protein B0H14DRAFT_2758549 [Mycena olivaceomarginata]